MACITLLALRISNGYTVDQVADLCGVTTTEIKGAELDSSDMPYGLLLKMVDLFNIDIDHIYLGNASHFRQPPLLW